MFPIARRRGVTLTDVTVLLFVLLMVGTTIPAITCRSRETANRVKCAANLRTIGQGFLLYANANKFFYPRTIYDAASADTPVWYTGSSSSNPWVSNGPKPNDVTAALFLLLRTQDLTSEVFICPTSLAERWDFAEESDSFIARPTKLDRSNFPSEKYLSYAYHNPYPSNSSSAKSYKSVASIDAGFAVAADMALKGSELLNVTPGMPSRKMRTANSPNHDGDGQNVLYGDGHVEFLSTIFVGFNGDNIYTVGRKDDKTNLLSATLVGSPAYEQDSILLPAASSAMNRNREQMTTSWLLGPWSKPIQFLVLVMLLTVVVVVVCRFGRSSK